MLTVESLPEANTRRPDFAVIGEKGFARLYVEAVAPHSDPAFGPRGADEALVLDTIDSIDSERFCVMLGQLDQGTYLPKRVEIQRPN